MKLNRVIKQSIVLEEVFRKYKDESPHGSAADTLCFAARQMLRRKRGRRCSFPLPFDAGFFISVSANVFCLLICPPALSSFDTFTRLDAQSLPILRSSDVKHFAGMIVS